MTPPRESKVPQSSRIVVIFAKFNFAKFLLALLTSLRTNSHLDCFSSLTRRLHQKAKRDAHCVPFCFSFWRSLGIEHARANSVRIAPRLPFSSNYKTARTNRVHIRTADASSLFVSGKVANIRHRRNCRFSILIIKFYDFFHYHLHSCFISAI